MPRFPLPILVVLLLGFPACTTQYPARDPVGETLPRVVGETLAGERIVLPDDLAGSPAVLVVVYESAAQDEAKFWAPVAVANLPDGRHYQVAAFTKLEHLLGRRRLTARAHGSVPESLHEKMVALWWDGRAFARFTGSPRDGRARVLILDAAGTVVYFSDQGFNAQTLRAFVDACDAQRADTTADR